MATAKNAKESSEMAIEPENNESDEEISQKIELISSSEDNTRNPLSELESEFDLFESEFSETVQPLETEQIEEEKPEKDKLENLEEEKPKKTKSKRTRKTKKSKTKKTETDKEETIDTKEPEKKKSKRTKKKSDEMENEKVKETSNIESKNPTESVKKESDKVVSEKKEVPSEIDIKLLTNSVSDATTKESIMSLYNENIELKANLEKAKKLLRVLKRKVLLAEENAEQWKVCAYGLGDIFAEKSHMPLEDVLRKFDAPISEEEL